MAIIRRTRASKKHILHLASGKVGLVIVKQYGDKMVISNRPDMSKVKWTARQKENNTEMAVAQSAASAVHNDPVLKERYTQMHNESPRRFRSLYNFVVSHTRQRLKEERLRREKQLSESL